MKVYVVGRQEWYSCFIEDLELVHEMPKADVVLFTGGEDIDPALYGCRRHPSTFFNTNRDRNEVKAWNEVDPRQLIVGICRGAQLACAMFGGILVQDCNNHAIAGTHPITDGRMMYEITSLHHQMQYPFTMPREDYDVLFSSRSLLSTHYSGDKVRREVLVENGEPEIVLYHKAGKPRCLGIQGHPEMMRGSHVVTLINELMNELAGKG